jgi:hypothetical protein
MEQEESVSIEEDSNLCLFEVLVLQSADFLLEVGLEPRL